jgi:hypothetical protein
MERVKPRGEYHVTEDGALFPGWVQVILYDGALGKHETFDLCKERWLEGEPRFTAAGFINGCEAQRSAGKACGHKPWAGDREGQAAPRIGRPRAKARKGR